jgi:hypothetical protein
MNTAIIVQTDTSRSAHIMRDGVVIGSVGPGERLVLEIVDRVADLASAAELGPGKTLAPYMESSEGAAAEIMLAAMERDGWEFSPLVPRDASGSGK